MNSHAAPDKTTAPQLPELVSVEELARRWSLKPGTIRKWAREGRLPAFKLGGGLWAFDARDLAAYLADIREASGGR